MKECYDFKNKYLYLDDKIKNKFKIKFNWNKTVVDGKSGTGKTLLVTKIKEIQEDTNNGIKPYSANNIVIIDAKNLKELKNQKNKLIIIDRAEHVIKDDDIDYINTDFYNHYLIFCRKPLGLDISPNHYAEFIRNNNEISIKYEFNEDGWF